MLAQSKQNEKQSFSNSGAIMNFCNAEHSHTVYERALCTLWSVYFVCSVAERTGFYFYFSKKNGQVHITCLMIDASIITNTCDTRTRGKPNVLESVITSKFIQAHNSQTICRDTLSIHDDSMHCGVEFWVLHAIAAVRQRNVKFICTNVHAKHIR